MMGQKLLLFALTEPVAETGGTQRFAELATELDVLYALAKREDVRSLWMKVTVVLLGAAKLFKSSHDVIICFEVYSAVPAFLARKRYVILHRKADHLWRIIEGRHLGNLSALLYRRIIRRAALNIFQTRHDYARHTAFYKVALRHRVVPNNINCSFIEQLHTLAPLNIPWSDRALVTFLGDSAKRKNGAYVARLDAILKDMYGIEVTSPLIGEGASMRLSRSEVASLYRATRIVLIPSLAEGFANVFLEALSFGCVPMLSRIPEHVEIAGEDYPYFLDSDLKKTALAISRIVNSDADPFDAGSVLHGLIKRYRFPWTAEIITAITAAEQA
jgi:hypothetical protein